jgi:hypothetical protein
VTDLGEPRAGEDAAAPDMELSPGDLLARLGGSAELARSRCGSRSKATLVMRPIRSAPVSALVVKRKLAELS